MQLHGLGIGFTHFKTYSFVVLLDLALAPGHRREVVQPTLPNYVNTAVSFHLLGPNF